MLWMGRWFALRHDLRVALRHELRPEQRPEQRHGLGHELRLEQRHELAGEEQASRVCVGRFENPAEGESALFSQRPEKAAPVADKRKCTPCRAATN